MHTHPRVSFARVYSIYVGWFGTFSTQFNEKRKELGPENPISGPKFSPKYHFSHKIGRKTHETNKNCKQMVFTTYSRQLNLKAIHKDQNGSLRGTRKPDFGPKIQPKIQFFGHSYVEIVQNPSKPYVNGIYSIIRIC